MVEKNSVIRQSGLELMANEQESRELLLKSLNTSGMLFFAPNWVPRSFCIPGKRIKLHPNDYYAFGAERGGVDERWFASTTAADNGPLTWEHEGLSAVVLGDGKAVLFRDAVQILGPELLGEKVWNEQKGWMMYSKFFDNQEPLPHHVHQRLQHVQWEGKLGKPESYFFPTQVNNHGGDRPTTYFGLNPGVTKAQLRDCLAAFELGDNKLLTLSRAYELRPGTGWDVPAGILHAPGSLCTYEPQRASDVFAMYQSVIEGRRVVPPELLWKDCPPEKIGDYDYLVDVLDWEANVDPHFKENHYSEPKPVGDEAQMRQQGYVDNWVSYRSGDYTAKETTILPGQTVTLRDGAPYGFIVMQGYGTMGGRAIESPALIRFGQLTRDEGFVSAQAAKDGIRVTNLSPVSELVMLRHYGPNNPDLKHICSIN